MGKAKAKYKRVNKKDRRPKRPRHTRIDPILGNSKGPSKPFIRGTVTKVMIINSKKPNSANRKCIQAAVTVLWRDGTLKKKRINAYCPGEYPDGHGLQVNNTVLLRAGGPKDCSGVKYSVVPGVLDAKPVSGRINGGSRFGASPKKNREEALKKSQGGK
jgi:ribosomal protein S12